MSQGCGAVNEMPDPDGATPLDHEERDGLIPAYIATREDLNGAEQANITKALVRLRRRRLTTPDVLDDAFVRSLHKAMFADVWRWAGTYRLTERNIGCGPQDIPVKVRDLVEDARWWIGPEVDWISPDEALCRVHHRLVHIHPFPNGNGRHARMFTDLLARTSDRPPFTWGSGGDLLGPGPDRAAYLAALRRADRDPNDVASLVAFARS